MDLRLQTPPFLVTQNSKLDICFCWWLDTQQAILKETKSHQDKEGQVASRCKALFTVQWT